MDDITRQAIDLAERETGLKLDEKEQKLVEDVTTLVVEALKKGTMPFGPHQPEGDFQCLICLKHWRGAELVPQPYGPVQTWVCADSACGGPVGKITGQIAGATDGR